MDKYAMFGGVDKWNWSIFKKTITKNKERNIKYV